MIFKKYEKARRDFNKEQAELNKKSKGKATYKPKTRPPLKEQKEDKVE